MIPNFIGQIVGFAGNLVSAISTGISETRAMKQSEREYQRQIAADKEFWVYKAPPKDNTLSIVFAVVAISLILLIAALLYKFINN